MRTSRNGRAVVIGASLAGLLAARALHESFGEVVVLDRDTLPERPRPRRGLPHGGDAHWLTVRGRWELDELFEGLSPELIGLGAPTFDVRTEFRWWMDGRPLATGPSGLIGLAAGRPLLEFAIRRRVAALPNVRIRPGHAVSDLITTPEGDRVTGVVAIAAGGDQVTVNDVDLVVDASGRSSRARYWLAQLGYPEVEEERIETRVTAVTRHYRRLPGQLGGRYGTSVPAYPGLHRGGFLLAQENDTWIAALHGWFGATPPDDDAGLVAWAEELDSPDLAEVMRTSPALGEPVRTRFPAGVRLRYDRLGRFPAGFLVTGDAMCVFNPVHGPGMTVAALAASALARLLKDGADDLAARFFAETAAILDGPWTTASADDLRFPETAGDRSTLDPRRDAYLLRLRAAATGDPVLANAFLRVTQMVDPPAALFAPEIAGRVPT
ncbi:squalene monooxygenase [Actinoplanes sp. NPDC049265]|uniref:NAD(P)/FAD-dependent oxidoreductase n=1 Tax=Actinoplanes sp. NPDC049265 TaxID=3363902 RepID=UPI003722F62C